MNVYENLDLKNNRVINVRPQLASGDWPTGTASAGALKYTANGLYMYYTPSGTNPSTEQPYEIGWYLVGAYSGTQPTPNNGNFQVNSASTGSAVASNVAIDFTVNNNNSTGTAMLFTMDNKGSLRIANGNTSSDKYVKVDVAGSIAGVMVFSSVFQTTAAGNQYITIENPLKTDDLVITVYEQDTYKLNGSDVTCYNKIACEVMIKNREDQYAIEVGLLGVTSGKTFKVVGVGAPGTIVAQAANDVKTAKTITIDSANDIKNTSCKDNS